MMEETGKKFPPYQGRSGADEKAINGPVMYKSPPSLQERIGKTTFSERQQALI